MNKIHWKNRTGIRPTLALVALVAIAVGAAAVVAQSAQAPLSTMRPRTPRETGWVLVANHLHSAPMGPNSWTSGIRLIRGYCTEHHIDFACLTDHNTIKGWFDPAFLSAEGTTMIPGEEWTSNEGHANILGFSAQGLSDAIIPQAQGGTDGRGHSQAAAGLTDPASLDGRQPGGPHPDHERMVRTVHARGGIVIINHPATPGYAWPENDFGADACEVNRTFRDWKGVGAKAFYERRLMTGSKLAAVGGSDFHAFRSPAAARTELGVANPTQQGSVEIEPADAGAGGPGQDAWIDSTLMPVIDQPVNLVLPSGPGRAGVLAAIVAHHVQVLVNPGAPRCFVAVDTAGNGSFDAGIAGDSVRAIPGQPIRMRIHVVGGRGQTLSIHDVTIAAARQKGSAAVTTLPIDADDFVTVVTRPVGPQTHHATFFEVGELQTLTNPVWY